MDFLKLLSEMFMESFGTENPHGFHLPVQVLKFNLSQKKRASDVEALTLKWEAEIFQRGQLTLSNYFLLATRLTLNLMSLLMMLSPTAPEIPDP